MLQSANRIYNSLGLFTPSSNRKNLLKFERCWICLSNLSCMLYINCRPGDKSQICMSGGYQAVFMKVASMYSNWDVADILYVVLCQGIYSRLQVIQSLGNIQLQNGTCLAYRLWALCSSDTMYKVYTIEYHVMFIYIWDLLYPKKGLQNAFECALWWRGVANKICRQRTFLMLHLLPSSSTWFLKFV